MKTSHQETANATEHIIQRDQPLSRAAPAAAEFRPSSSFRCPPQRVRVFGKISDFFPPHPPTIASAGRSKPPTRDQRDCPTALHRGGRHLTPVRAKTCTKRLVTALPSKPPEAAPPAEAFATATTHIGRHPVVVRTTPSPPTQNHTVAQFPLTGRMASGKRRAAGASIVFGQWCSTYSTAACPLFNGAEFRTGPGRGQLLLRFVRARASVILRVLASVRRRVRVVRGRKARCRAVWSRRLVKQAP